jgi:8-oxo-dGTP diphosphatase
MKNSTLCYLEKNGKYLMLFRDRKENDENAGKWIGVGGKFENGESPDECLLREVFEETGLKLKEYRLRGIVSFVSDIYETEYMFLYTSGSFEGTLTECSEGRLEWIDKESVPELPLWEGDRIFLNLIRDDKDFFSLKLVYERDSLKNAVLDGKEIKI